MPQQIPEAINQSGLKLFSQCPNLYKERYLEMTNVAPEKDYFTYGSLVDAILTNPENVDNLFYVGKKKRETNPLELLAKKTALEKEIIDLTDKAKEGNKTALKGISSRQAKIAEIDEQLTPEDASETRKLVTPSMWEDAHETAEAISQLDLWKRLTKASHVFQPELVSTKIKRRGTFDVLSGSDAVITLFKSFQANLIQYEAFREAVDKLPENERWLVIGDVKSTADLKEFNATKVREMYAIQLAFYRSLVREIFGIEPECVIIAGDKANGFKMAEEYIFSSETLDWADARAKEVEEVFWRCANTYEWPAAKEIHGSNQECFTCSKCRMKPHSKTNKPVIV